MKSSSEVTKAVTACEMAKVSEFRLGSGRAFTKPIIYWHLANHTPDMDADGNIEAFRLAFEVWALTMYPIMLESTSEKKKANITIYFANNGDKDLPLPFDRNTLAYTYYPMSNKSDMWMNDKINWGAMHTPKHYNLRKVVAHEIGHALNVGHSSIKGDVMEAIYTPNDRIVLSADTHEAIKTLYSKVKAKIHLPPLKEVVGASPGIRQTDSTLKTVLRIVFPNELSLYRLKPDQLSNLSEALEIGGKDKRDTIKKIYTSFR